MNRSSLIKLLLFTIFLFEGCKKYEEDPFFINFRSPEARIHGTWDLEYLSIDNSDSTNAVKNQHCYFQLSFLNDEETHQGTINLVGDNFPSDTCYLEGVYQFMNNNNDLCLSCIFSDMRLVGPFPCGQLYSGQPDQGTCWKIVKLTGSQLWLETTYDNSFCWAHLKKTS